MSSDKFTPILEQNTMPSESIMTEDNKKDEKKNKEKEECCCCCDDNTINNICNTCFFCGIFCMLSGSR